MYPDSGQVMVWSSLTPTTLPLGLVASKTLRNARDTHKGAGDPIL